VARPLPAAAQAQLPRAVPGDAPATRDPGPVMPHEGGWGPLIFADAGRVMVALAVWRRLRHTGGLHPHKAARQADWDQWMSGYERSMLLGMSLPDLWAYLAVVEAETQLIEALAWLADEPDMRAALEQHRPQRGDP
jgi:hypothetical protein